MNSFVSFTKPKRTKSTDLSLSQSEEGRTRRTLRRTQSNDDSMDQVRKIMGDMSGSGDSSSRRRRTKLSESSSSRRSSSRRCSRKEREAVKEGKLTPFEMIQMLEASADAGQDHKAKEAFELMKSRTYVGGIDDSEHVVPKAA